MKNIINLNTTSNLNTNFINLNPKKKSKLD